MLNLIRADLYRILRSKALWITFSVLVVFVVASGMTGVIGTIGMYNSALEDLNTLKSGSMLQLGQMAAGDDLFYFFLPILVVVVTTDFTNGTVKNTLGKGCSRVTYYCSKLILSMVVCSVFVVMFNTFPLLVGTLLYGLGDYFETYNYFRILATQIPLYLAVVSLGCFIALTVKKTASLNAIYIPMFIVAQIVITILVNLNSKFIALMDFELSMGVRKYALVETITNNDILAKWGLGIIVIVITTVLGIILFRRSEIK